MRVLIRYLLAASVLVVAGLAVSTLGRLTERVAGAEIQLLTMAYGAPLAEHDAMERDLGWLMQVPGISTLETGVRQQRATANYWQHKYADLALKTTTAGETTERDPALLLLAANAAFRSVAPAEGGAAAVARLEGLLTQYADALRRVPWQFDAAFNYEFIARRRDALVRSRGKAAPAQKEAGTEVPAHTIHGRAGAVPPGVDMSEFKVVVPQRSDERSEQPEAGKGGPRARKG